MKLRLTGFIIPIFFVLISGCNLKKELTLVSGGEPNAVIVTASGASEAERFAADEIQKYIQKITGAKLKILTDDENAEGNLILIGRTKITSELGVDVDSDFPNDDPFIIKTIRNRLILLGKGDRGTVYSVYTFLEDYTRCRWVMPGEAGEQIPKKETITVSHIDRIEEPEFEFRIAGGFRSADYIDWAFKNKLHILRQTKIGDNLSAGKGDTDSELIKRGGPIYGTMGHAFFKFISPQK